MMNRSFLTGIFILGLIAPAMAETSYISNQSTCDTDTLGSASSANLIANWSPISYTITYNANGGSGTLTPTSYTVEDTVSLPSLTKTGYSFGGWCDNSGLTGTCVTSLPAGTTGNQTLWAKYSGNTYTCPAGQYLRASDATCQPCTAGNYCPDSQDYTYNGIDTGLSSCPAEYPYSATGTNMIDNCYTSGNVLCSVYNPYIFGHGSVATYRSGTGATASVPYKRYYDGPLYTLDTANACDMMTLNCDTGYTAGPGDLIGYIDTNPSTSTTNSANGTFSVSWADGTKVTGKTHCDALGGIDGSGSVATNIPSGNTGSECWCNLIEYNITNGTTREVSVPVWLSADNQENCASDCPAACVNELAYTYSRKGFFGGLGSQLACQPNTLNLDWDPDNGNAHTQNTCTYDGAITIPTAPEKVGYTFNGWVVQ